MSEVTIPIVRTLPSGGEIAIGCAFTMESATQLLDTLTARFPKYDLFVDCSRTVDEVQQDYRADKAFGWTAAA